MNALTKLTLLVLLCAIIPALHGATRVPLHGNSYITTGDAKGAKIDRNGLYRWTSPGVVVSMYFKVPQKGELDLALEARNMNPSSRVSVSVGGEKFEVDINNKILSTIPIGKVNLSKAGYVKVDFQGLEKNGAEYGELINLIVDGEATKGQMAYCGDFESHWALCGPSVHLRYTLPEGVDTEWFYNEITVPRGNDVVGSYFMANGFAQGYFGIQVNSPTERRVLFSVWSPYTGSQNPADIPEDQRIKALKSGQGVHVGEFGDEGVGGQSYLKYNWKAGQTYKFLVRVRPEGNKTTSYTAYFYSPENPSWQLIASFLRPQTDTYYKMPYSFSESFIPNEGYITRRANFTNQWVCTSKGEWIELTDAMFTYDATAEAGVRVDYAGGEVNRGYFLKNCGFFDESTPAKTTFKRRTTGKAPMINLSDLQ